MNDNVNIGVINGGNNTFNQNNHFHQDRKEKKAPQQTDKPADASGAAMGLIMGVFVGTAVVAVNYLLHREIIFFWMHMALIAGCMLHLASFGVRILSSSCTSHPWWAATAVLLALVLVFLIGTTGDATLPEAAIALQGQSLPTKGLVPLYMEIWQSFKPDDQHIILNNLGSAILLAVAVFLNVAIGLQQMVQTVAEATQVRILALLDLKLRIVPVIAVFGTIMAAAGAFVLTI